MAPDTGFSQSSDVTCVWAIEGEVADSGARLDFEATIFQRLAARDVPIDMIDVNPEGISFVVDTPSLEAVRSALADLNVALKLRSHCTRVAVAGFRGARFARRSLTYALQALAAAHIVVYHCVCRGSTLALVVDERDATRVTPVLRSLGALAPPSAA
jgi:aspartokinase